LIFVFHAFCLALGGTGKLRDICSGHSSALVVFSNCHYRSPRPKGSDLGPRGNQYGLQAVRWRLLAYWIWPTWERTQVFPETDRRNAGCFNREYFQGPCANRMWWIENR